MEDSDFASATHVLDPARVLMLIRDLDQDYARRPAILIELRQMPREPLFAFLVGLLPYQNSVEDDRQNLRGLAARALLMIDPDQAVPLVVPLLQDSFSPLRWWVAGCLGDYGDVRATEALDEMLRADPDGDNRLIAAAVLGRIGDARALPTLERTVRTDHGTDQQGRSVAQAAAEAIQAIQARTDIM